MLGSRVKLMRLRDLWRWQMEDGHWITHPLGPSWRWQRNDGEWVSPMFTSLGAAYYFAKKMPFLSDLEWKEQYPIPADAIPTINHPFHELRGIKHED